jgi:Fe-S cluster assembly protein SufD
MLRFHDITHDTETTYRLSAHEQAVFFLWNRPGDITFELCGEGAAAHIFALFTLTGSERRASHIHQVHLAPKTTSSFTGRSLLSQESTCDWKGSLSIAKDAAQSEGHQEMRQLLLSREARASSFPSLEIKTDDVRCGHAATLSALDSEHLFFLQSRGLSESQATTLIAQGFISDLFEKIQALGVDFPVPETTHLKKRMHIP